MTCFLRLARRLNTSLMAAPMMVLMVNAGADDITGHVGPDAEFVSPCDAITYNAWPEIPDWIPERLVDAERLEGRWFGGPVTGDFWQPEIIELTCDGTSIPFSIQESFISFPVKQSTDSPFFTGVLKDDLKLEGSLADGTHYIFYAMEDNHENFDYQLNAGNSRFGWFRNKDNRAELFDGEKIQPLWSLRYDLFLNADGQIIRFENSHPNPLRQIQIGSRFGDFDGDFSSTPISRNHDRIPVSSHAWAGDGGQATAAVLFQLEKLDDSAVVILDPSLAAIDHELRDALKIQITGRGFNLLSPFDHNGDLLTNNPGVWFDSAVAYINREQLLDQNRILLLQWSGDEPKIDPEILSGIFWFSESDDFPVFDDRSLSTVSLWIAGDEAASFDNGKTRRTIHSGSDSFFIDSRRDVPHQEQDIVHMNSVLLNDISQWLTRTGSLDSPSEDKPPGSEAVTDRFNEESDNID